MNFAPRCLSLKLIGLVAAAVSSVGLAHSQDNWYLVQSQPGNNHWNMTSSSQAYKHWADANNIFNYDGFENHYATRMDPAANYIVRGSFDGAMKQLRTQTITSGSDTFGGGKLTMDGTDLLIRASDTGVSHVEHLVVQGARFFASAANGNPGTNRNHNLSIGLLLVDSSAGASQFTVGDTSIYRTHNVTIDTLIGSGDLIFQNGAGTSTGTIFNFDVDDASNYSGELRLVSGQLVFISDFESVGSLAFEGGTFALRANVSVGKLTIDGKEISPGEYNASRLTALGISTTGKGKLVVIPEPGSAAWFPAMLIATSVLSRRKRHNPAPQKFQ